MRFFKKAIWIAGLWAAFGASVWAGEGDKPLDSLNREELIKRLQTVKEEKAKTEIINQIYEKTYDKALSSELKNQIWLASAIASFVVGLGAFFGVSSYREMKATVQQVVKDKQREIDRQIQDALESYGEKRQEAIMSLIDQRQEDIMLARERKVIVVSSATVTQDSINKLKTYFTEMGFEKVKYYRIEDLPKEQAPDCHALFLNNAENSKQALKEFKETVWKYYKMKANSLFFYYGSLQLHLVDRGDTTPSDQLPKLNYCNSEITIYQNLIDALRYQHRILSQR